MTHVGPVTACVGDRPEMSASQRPLWQIGRVSTDAAAAEPTDAPTAEVPGSDVVRSGAGDPVGPRAPHEGGGHPTAALVVLVASLTTAGAALLLAWLNRTELHHDIWFFVVDVADAVIYGTVAYVLLRRVRHPVAWIVAMTGVGGGIAALGMQWLSFQASNPELPPLALLGSAIGWGWIPGTLSLVVIVPWLVRDDRVPWFGRAAIGAGILVTGTLMLTQLTDPWPYPDGDPFTPLAIRSEWWAGFVMDAYPPLMTAVVVLGLLAAADTYRRWTILPTDRRRGLGWLTVGAVLLSVSFVPVAAINSFGADMSSLFTPLTHLASQAFFPAAILVVVLGQRLWGIDLVVSRALVWGLLSATVVAAYVAIVTVTTRLLSIQDDVLQVVAAAIVAAGFQPAKVWIQRRVDALVHGESREPMHLVRRVGGGFDRADPGDVLDDVATSIRTSLRLRSVNIVADDGRCVASSSVEADRSAPTSDEHRRSMPLVLYQRDIGHLEVEPRTGERLDGRTLELLSSLLPLVAATVQLTETTTALADSRRRLAVARDADRRRLRRELHDGLGPALAGTALALRAGGNLMSSDPEQVTVLVGRSADELDRLVEQVRAMSRGLLPPTLDEDGLVPALQELAEVHSTAGVDIRLRASVHPVLFAEDATAVYAVVAEAVRNVVRHSEATQCRIELDMRRVGGRTELVVCIADDGIGIDDTSTAGVGLTSMREWAGELGGEVTVTRADPIGTMVTVVVPVADGARARRAPGDATT